VQTGKVILIQVLSFFIAAAVAHCQTVKDIDDNIYKTVTIGTQVWMAENLRTTRFNDGTAIPLITENKGWTAMFSPAYFWYGNSEKGIKCTYGALYNWYAVSTDKLCPAGWHVPDNKEWKALIKNLKGGARAAGVQLKETGTEHWQGPNKGATNSSGFTALPGGYREGNGNFHDLGRYGGWWSKTEASANKADYRGLLNDSRASGYGTSYKASGFSVRCVRND
jgi:uncharacterized protein (TIGR02145 family)